LEKKKKLKAWRGGEGKKVKISKKKKAKSRKYWSPQGVR